MKATITYEMNYLPHPFDEKLRARGVEAWCLVKVTRPVVGSSEHEPIAIFNLDRDGQQFQFHVLAEGLNGRLVTAHHDVARLYATMTEGRQQP